MTTVYQRASELEPPTPLTATSSNARSCPPTSQQQMDPQQFYQLRREEEAAKAAKGEGKRETLALKCPPKMVKVHLPNPGYGREQIPRLSRFICVLFVHVWSSNSLAETLECKMNPFLVVYVQNILEITRMPLPVITLAIKYTQRLRRLLMIQAESESASSRSRHPSQLRRLTPMEGPTWPSSRLFANATPSRTSFTSFSMTNEEARVLSVALILAQKYSDDAPYGNRVWGQILGLGAGMLSSLEARFLALIGFNLYVNEAEYISFCRGVQALAREWNRSLAVAAVTAAALNSGGKDVAVVGGLPSPVSATCGSNGVAAGANLVATTVAWNAETYGETDEFRAQRRKFRVRTENKVMEASAMRYSEMGFVERSQGEAQMGVEMAYDERTRKRKAGGSEEGEEEGVPTPDPRAQSYQTSERWQASYLYRTQIPNAMASVAPTEVRESYQDAGLLESNTGRYRQHRPAQLRVETSIRRPVPVTAQAQLQPSWNMELPRSLNEYVGATHAAQQNPSIPSVSFTPSHDSAPIINEATPNVSLPKTLPSVSATLPHPFLTIPSASTPTTMSPLPSLNPSTLDAFTATASKAYGLALTPTLHSTFPTTPTGTSDRSTTSPLRPFAMTPNPMTSFSQNNSIPFNPSPSSQLHLYLPPPNFATSTTHEMPHPMFQQHGVSSPRFHALAMVDSSSAQSAKVTLPSLPAAVAARRGSTPTNVWPANGWGEFNGRSNGI